MTMPSVEGFQELIGQCLQLADISPLDVDACDLYADGRIMADALEVSATGRAYRPDGMPNIDHAPPLALLASKSPLGNQVEACGLLSLVKVLIRF
mmetsp:Transcript_25312/g.84538  ORF Transcript_25312/g.84538 Transcript_25312/m.84538 type:complete len:95 (+) Transcript_25312:606-890(+)